MRQNLFKDGIQRDAQIETSADGQVDRSQAAQAVHLFNTFIEQTHPMNRIAANLGQRVQNAQIVGRQFTRQVHVDEHGSHHFFSRVQRDARPARALGDSVAILFRQVRVRPQVP